MPRVPKLLPVAATELAPAPKKLFIGISGWGYKTWKPGFYPSDIPERGFLHYYGSRFNSVEVNHTFRKLPEARVLQSWLDSVPPGFRFSFKAPEQITHRKRLLDCHDVVATFVEAIRPAHRVGKLGALLFQLPPNFKLNLQRLEGLLCAPALGKGSDRIAVAVEFRNASWFCEETYTLLREHNAALCVADTEDLVTPDVVTAPFRYYRLRKPGGYSSRVLGVRAQGLVESRASGEAFAYLMHEDEPTGALNALALIRKGLKLERIVEKNA